VKIFVVGEPIHLAECREKFGAHTFTFAADHRSAEKLLQGSDLIFDFIIDKAPSEFSIYATQSTTVFLNTCRISLLKLVHGLSDDIACTVFGFNGLSGMVTRSMLEVSVLSQKDTSLLQNACDLLNTAYLLVDDRVGMVTPRVISMIINDAYYTVQEGTASREDIDLAMKLGTNYPYGPFEWCERIGVKEIYEVLDAVYADTKDERYKICPLLKKEYLMKRGEK
jgi:3-hydroxybutyryl-CoA dehydrogenase